MSTGFASFTFAFGPFAAFGPSGIPVLGSSLRLVPAPARLVVDGDYVLESTGLLGKSTDPTADEVRFRLATIKGSLVGEPEVGSGVTNVRIFTDAAPVEIQREVELALDPMVADGRIANVRVKATPYVRNATGVAAYAVDYDPTGLI